MAFSRGGDSYYESYGVPAPVQKFVERLSRRIRDRNAFEVHQIYTQQYQKLNHKYFSVTRWPTADQVGDYCTPQWDETFLILYKQMYFRHIFSARQQDNPLDVAPSLEELLDSFQNYIDLFNTILRQNDEEPVIDELPNQWVWDMVDDFVNQYQYYQRNFRLNQADLPSNMRAMIEDNPKAWSVDIVLKYLHALASKGRVPLQHNPPIPANPDEDGHVSSVSAMLGFFAVVGLSKVHVLSGDYRSAIQVLDVVDGHKRSAMARIYSCHMSAFYMLGFSYLMVGRFQDASKLITGLYQTWQRRTEGQSKAVFHLEDEQIRRDATSMRSLLALIRAIAPYQGLEAKAHEELHESLRTEFAPQLDAIQHGTAESRESAIKELIAQGSPDFVYTGPCNRNNPQANKIVVEQQCRTFYRLVSSRFAMPKVSSALKNYSSIPLSKLAHEDGEAKLSAQLVALKQQNRQLLWSGGAPGTGKFECGAAYDFYISNKMVHIFEAKQERKYSNLFLKHINKFEDMMDDIRRISLD